MNFNSLRKKYPRFVYEDFSYEVVNNNLEIIFNFLIPPDTKFKPKIIIENIPDSWKSDIQPLENLIFHLGLMEIPSYWKATCSPTIEIRAGFLDLNQIKWWHDLLINGLGQFFYENKIDWRGKDFLEITQKADVRGFDLQRVERSNLSISRLKNRYLVPFAGGRDSIVTLEALKKQKKEIALFTVNPIEKIQKVVNVSGIKKQIIVRRLIDKKLLALNKKGYLNGHTPFTSLLSFISVLCAVIFDYKNIAFSNEKSAEEGNVRYLGKIINHQWAKSLEFEKMFRNYCKKYLTYEVEYFSYLRKYGELEISKIFSKYNQYFKVFSSCNDREVKWCGNCPKCLFVYTALYPYLNKKELNTIFGKDIFQNKNLLPAMKDMLEEGRVKPLECVGTKKESRLAFKLCLQKVQKSGKIPYLLTKLK